MSEKPDVLLSVFHFAQSCPRTRTLVSEVNPYFEISILKFNRQKTINIKDQTIEEINFQERKSRIEIG